MYKHYVLGRTKYVFNDINIGIIVKIVKRKKVDIWLSPMTKAPTPTEKSKKQRDNIKNATKTSITQRLRTDLGRSVWVTTATQLVRLNRFTGSQPSHLPQKPCSQKDASLKM